MTCILEDFNRVPILSQPEGQELLSFLCATFTHGGVPILSQPEGQELQLGHCYPIGTLTVPILSQPEGQELLLFSDLNCAPTLSSNPLPARRPGATCQYQR